MSAEVGDVLVAVSGGTWGPRLGRSSAVKRITPSGQVVLECGTRLKATKWRAGVYEEMGRDSWSRTTWHAKDSDEVRKAAKEETARRLRGAVRDAAEEFWCDSGPETARAVIVAAQKYIDEADQ